MISLWRNGFGSDSSWEVHHAPSGDYRITVRGVGEEWPEQPSYDEFWMTCRVSEIVQFAAPYTLFALDPWVVQELLDLHAAVYPTARHPSASELLRRRHHGEYLDALGSDLEDAVRRGLLRVEKLERPWPFVEVEEKPQAPKPQEPAKEEEKQPVSFRVLANEDGMPFANATAVILYPDGREVQHNIDKDGWVRIQGLAGQTFELLRVIHPEEQYALAMGTRSSSSGTA